MTPEGRVKKKVRRYLDTVGPNLWYFMPVPMLYQVRTLDYIGCYRGNFFAIETKAPGESPTNYQLLTIDKMLSAGAHVVVIDGDEAIARLKQWFAHIDTDGPWPAAE